MSAIQQRGFFVSVMISRMIFSGRNSSIKITHVLVNVMMLLGLLLAAGCQSFNSSQSSASTTIPATQPPVKSDDRIISEGEVSPIAYAYLSFSNSGVLAEVLIQEGEAVKSGQVIARLKGSERLKASISAAELELLAASQALETLNKNADVARAQAQLQVANANKALDEAKEERESKKYKRANQSIIDREHAALILAQDAFDRAEEIWAAFEGKDEEDVNRAAALSQFSRAQQELDRAKANYNYVNSPPDQFDVDIADGELVLAQARYAQALRDFEAVKTGPDPDDLALAEARVDNAKNQLAAAQAVLEDQELIAPFDGILVDSDLKIGELVGPAAKPVLLANLAEYEIITTDLTERSVVGIQEGAPVTVSFDAIPDLELTGKVSRIKTLGENKQGDITYAVYIRLAAQDARLRWKMTAVVTFEKE